MIKSVVFYTKVGHCMLESKDCNSKIHFLGAEFINKDTWKLKFSFERIGYKYDNVSEGGFIYFADYFGEIETKEVKVGRITKKTKTEVNYKKVEKIEIVAISQL